MRVPLIQGLPIITSGFASIDEAASYGYTNMPHRKESAVRVGGGRTAAGSTWTPQAKEGDCVQVIRGQYPRSKQEALLRDLELIINCKHSWHTVSSYESQLLVHIC
jgi:hypothetical protein